MRFISLMAVVLIIFGISGSVGAADCNQGGNLVSNCDFTTDMTDWSLFYGDSWSHQGGDGATALGSVEIDAEFLGGKQVMGESEYRARIDSGCMPFLEGTAWDWGISAKLVGGGRGTQTSCDIRATFYSGVACTGGLGSASGGSGGIPQIDSTWQEGFAEDSGISPGTTQSVIFSVYCVNNSADFVVRIDDALFGQNLVPVELMTFSVE